MTKKPQKQSDGEKQEKAVSLACASAAWVPSAQETHHLAR